MRRSIYIILLSCVSFCASAQMVNNIPNYLYSGSLGVGRNTANDANVYLQVGPNGAGTKGVLLPRVADTASISGTKRNGLLIYSNQLAGYAYYDSVNARWWRLTTSGVTNVATGYGLSGGPITSTGTVSADTSSLATKLWAEKAVDDTAAVLRALAGSSRISGLTAANATNSIDNADYNQEWRWNSLTGANGGLYLYSSSTSGVNANRLLNIARSGANSSSSITTYGLYSSVVNTGTSSSNYGGYFTASGATTNGGVYAVGSQYGVRATSTGTSGTAVYGFSNDANSKGVDGTVTATSGTNYGVYGLSNGSGATTNYGGHFTASGATTNYGLYATGTTYGIYAFNNSSSGQGITSFVNGSNSRSIEAYNNSTSGTNYGIYAQASGAGGTNNYALFLNATGATNNYALVTTSGNIGFGTNTPSSSAIVEMSSTSQGLLLPRMTKAQRDAISSPVAGLAVYQTDNTPGLRVYNGTNWMKFTEATD